MTGKRATIWERLCINGPGFGFWLLPVSARDHTCDGYQKLDFCGRAKTKPPFVQQGDRVDPRFSLASYLHVTCDMKHARMLTSY